LPIKKELKKKVGETVRGNYQSEQRGKQIKPTRVRRFNPTGESAKKEGRTNAPKEFAEKKVGSKARCARMHKVFNKGLKSDWGEIKIRCARKKTDRELGVARNGH